MQVYDAIVLAGGTGRRLGGIDKAVLDVGATTLLESVLAAVRQARLTVVVGPRRALPTGVVRVSENPPGGGPVAAVAAGLAQVESPVVVVLACDLPFITAAVVERLARAVAAHVDGGQADPGHARHGEGPDVAMLVDGAGRRQFLAAAYRTARLREALSRIETTDGAAMRRVVGQLTVTEMPADPEVTLDCDTWADVEHSRELKEGR